MKSKITTLVVLVGLLALAAVLFFWYRNNHPTDSMIRHRLLGSWAPVSADGRERTLSLNLDGHWIGTMTGKIRTVHEDGTWLFQSGMLTMIETNNDMEAQVPSTSVGHITHIDGHEFILQRERGGKIVYNRTKP